jgi:3,4-dihydroxy-2-butanone 4-phosphate synthase
MPMTWSGRGTSSLSDTVREAFCAGRDILKRPFDLARLAGLIPAGVLAEVVNDDGTMARLLELFAFKEKFRLKICSIECLIPK